MSRSYNIFPRFVNGVLLPSFFMTENVYLTNILPYSESAFIGNVDKPFNSGWFNYLNVDFLDGSNISSESAYIHTLNIDNYEGNFDNTLNIFQEKLELENPLTWILENPEDRQKKLGLNINNDYLAINDDTKKLQWIQPPCYGAVNIVRRMLKDVDNSSSSEDYVWQTQVEVGDGIKMNDAGTRIVHGMTGGRYIDVSILGEISCSVNFDLDKLQMLAELETAKAASLAEIGGATAAANASIAGTGTFWNLSVGAAGLAATSAITFASLGANATLEQIKIDGIHDINNARDSSISQINGLIDPISGRLTILENQNLEPRISVLESGQSDLNGLIVGLEGNISVLNSDLTSTKSRITVLESQNLNSRITTLENNDAGYSTISYVDSQDSIITTDIAGAKSRITVLEGQNLNSRITTLENVQETFALKSYVDTQDSGLNTRISTLENAGYSTISYVDNALVLKQDIIGNKITLSNASNPRFTMELVTAESGGNNGSNYRINKVSDTGVATSAFEINRATGSANLFNNLTVSGVVINANGVNSNHLIHKGYVDANLLLKADKTYTDSQDNLRVLISNYNTDQVLKADKSYVDSQDNLRVLISNYNTDQVLKADKSYVDSQDNLRVLQTTYNSEQALKASISYVDTQDNLRVLQSTYNASINQAVKTTSAPSFAGLTIGSFSHALQDGSNAYVLSGSRLNDYIVIKTSTGTGSNIVFTSNAVTFQDQNNVNILHLDNNTGKLSARAFEAVSMFTAGNITCDNLTLTQTINASDATKKSYVDAISYITAGTGITKTGSTLSVNALQTQITAVGILSSLSVSGSSTFSGAITIPAPTLGGHATTKTYVDSLYLAGTGLTKTGSTFSVNSTQTQITSVGTLSSLNVTGLTKLYCSENNGGYAQLLPPAEVLSIRRPGIQTETWENTLSFQLQRWEAVSQNSRTLATIALNHGNTSEATVNVLSLRSDGLISIPGSLNITGTSTFGNGIFTSTTDSSSITTGAVTIAGGLAVAKTLVTSYPHGVRFLTSAGNIAQAYMGCTTSGELTIGNYQPSGYIALNTTGKTLIVNTTDATSISSGSLVINGGVAINKTLVTCYPHGVRFATSTGNVAQVYMGCHNTITEELTIGNTQPSGYVAINTTGKTLIVNTTDSTSISTGSFIVNGGVGIAKSLFVGTEINLSNNSGSRLKLNSTSNVFFIGAVPSDGAGDFHIWDNTSGGRVQGFYRSSNTLSFGYLNATSIITIVGTTDSTLTTNGSLVISGGVGIAKNLNVGGAITCSGYTASGSSNIISSTSGFNIKRSDGNTTSMYIKADAISTTKLVINSTAGNISLNSTYTDIGGILVVPYGNNIRCTTSTGSITGLQMGMNNATEFLILNSVSSGTIWLQSPTKITLQASQVSIPSANIDIPPFSHSILDNDLTYLYPTAKAYVIKNTTGDQTYSSLEFRNNTSTALSVTNNGILDLSYMMRIGKTIENPSIGFRTWSSTQMFSSITTLGTANNQIFTFRNYNTGKQGHFDFTGENITSLSLNPTTAVFNGSVSASNLKSGTMVSTLRQAGLTLTNITKDELVYIKVGSWVNILVVNVLATINGTATGDLIFTSPFKANETYSEIIYGYQVYFTIDSYDIVVKQTNGSRYTMSTPGFKIKNVTYITTQ